MGQRQIQIAIQIQIRRQGRRRPDRRRGRFSVKEAVLGLPVEQG
jgi:hypothetical protein